jgi:hypothetical protein
MLDKGQRLASVLAAIDAANAQDPNHIEVDGHREPAELVYGRRMSATLARMAPDASEHLRIAARGQHVERWTSPRQSYPEGRVGYLNWRNHLKEFHAGRVEQIMTANGYQSESITRVRSLIRKERMKSDPESQLLEDVVCVVFLEYYLGEFSAKTDTEKLAGILAKTWKKMSPLGHAHARKLNLPPAIAALFKEQPDRFRNFWRS